MGKTNETQDYENVQGTRRDSIILIRRTLTLQCSIFLQVTLKDIDKE